ncbi:hypothetical protein NDU88_000480 [Pleurodeles waltl]|uniref:Uncharacterized protein n=1 Tax=Pleurodeles waltl TaxID=8319 RepID=A0AAV7N829_PLEWA|nr:hypothetical protein NDU88_000480 [Pleurodeles waltl]
MGPHRSRREVQRLVEEERFAMGYFDPQDDPDDWDNDEYDQTALDPTYQGLKDAIDLDTSLEWKLVSPSEFARIHKSTDVSFMKCGRSCRHRFSGTVAMFT